MKDEDDLLYIGQDEALCGVCGLAIGEKPHPCEACGALHHRDCFAYNEGCSVYGCSASGKGRGALTTYDITATAPEGRLAIRVKKGQISFARRDRRLWGWAGISLGGLAGFFTGIAGLGAIFPFGFFGAILFVGGMQLVRGRIEVLPGRLRVVNLWGDRVLQAPQVRVTRISWMNALFFYDEEGNQIFTLKGEGEEIDYAVRVLFVIAGVEVEGS